jgi:hypothetical protein
MSVFVEFLEKLPPNNKIPVQEMLTVLSDADLDFIEDSLINNKAVPTNIIMKINQAFKIVGFPGFTWGNCRTEFGFKGRFDFS